MAFRIFAFECPVTVGRRNDGNEGLHAFTLQILERLIQICRCIAGFEYAVAFVRFDAGAQMFPG